MKGVRCSSCRHYAPDHGVWCPTAQRIANARNTPRNCPAWQAILAIPVPSHAHVVQPPEPGRLPNGVEYPRPDFMGDERVFIH
jgi:hypothetical protein